MKPILILLSILFTASPFVQAADKKETPYRLIFITVDGVRYQEIYRKEQQLIKAREDFWFFGNPGCGQKMKIANKAALSVPGYQSIYSGMNPLTTCRDNKCKYVLHETFLDRLQNDYNLAYHDIGFLSSWYNNRYGATRAPGKFFMSTGPDAIIDPITGETPDELKSLVDRMSKDRPEWRPHRWDRHNFEYAFWYLKNIQPKVLAVGFLDPDEHGHNHDFPKYRQSIRNVDTYLHHFLRYLDENPEIGDNTHIVITTDHGRGRGLLRKKHGKLILSSYRVWAMVRPAPNWLKEHPNVGPSRKRKISHAALRTTVEALMDLEPRQGPDFEAPLLQLK